MSRFPRSAFKALAASVAVAGTLVPAVAAGSTASATTVAGQQVPFSFEFTGLGANRPVAVVYASGTQYSNGYLKRGASLIRTDGGGLNFVSFASNGFSLVASSDGTTVTVTDRLFVNELPLQGSGILPSGGAVTITNEDTHYSAHLATSGSFVIPTGIS